MGEACTLKLARSNEVLNPPSFISSTYGTDN
jgi:hypothetical protein